MCRGFLYAHLKVCRPLFDISSTQRLAACPLTCRVLMQKVAKETLGTLSWPAVAARLAQGALPALPQGAEALTLTQLQEAVSGLSTLCQLLLAREARLFRALQEVRSLEELCPLSDHGCG